MVWPELDSSPAQRCHPHLCSILGDSDSPAHSLDILMVSLALKISYASKTEGFIAGCAALEVWDRARSAFVLQSMYAKPWCPSSEGSGAVLMCPASPSWQGSLMQTQPIPCLMSQGMHLEHQKPNLQGGEVALCIPNLHELQIILTTCLGFFTRWFWNRSLLPLSNIHELTTQIYQTP